MSDEEAFRRYLSQKLITLWESYNNCSLSEEHRSVLDNYLDNPSRIAYGLDELTFEYDFLWGHQGVRPINGTACFHELIGGPCMSVKIGTEDGKT